MTLNTAVPSTLPEESELRFHLVHQQQGRVLAEHGPHPAGSFLRQIASSVCSKKKFLPLRGLDGSALDFRNVVDAFSLSTYSSHCLMPAVVPRLTVPFSQTLQV